MPWICSSKMRSQPCGGQEAHPAGLAPAGHDRLDLGHRPGVAVAVGRRDLGPAPPGVARIGGVQRRVGHGPDDELGRLQLVEVQRRRRDHDRHPVVLRLGQADVEVGAQRPGDLGGEPGPDGGAGDPAHDLADQVALGDGVVARRGAGLPPRLLGGQQPRCTSASRPGPRAPSARPSPAARRCGPSGAGPRRAPCRRRRTRASSGPPGRRSRARPGRPASARTGRSWSWWSTRRW